MATKRRKSKKQHNGNVVNGIKTDQSGRARRQFRFWLDETREDEYVMGVELENMKGRKARKFAPFIKNAIRLMLSLMTGDTLILCSLFPGIVEAIQQQGRAALEAQNAALEAQNAGYRALLDQQAETIDQLEAEVDMLRKQRQPAHVDFEDMLQSISAKLDTMRPGAETSPKQHQNSTENQILGLRKIAVAAPAFDDEDDSGLLVVEKDTSAGKKANENFIKSMFALQEAAS